MTIILPAVIEMPQGSCYKYEADKYDGRLLLHRVINQKIPHNYGYIENTLGEDGDPLDVFVLSSHPIPPLTKLKCRILKAVKCIDKGEVDDKLIGVIDDDPDFCNPAFCERCLNVEIERILLYLRTYKEGFIVNEVVDINEAHTIINKCGQAWIDK
jgi:inorganic pyrophosphatase